MNIENSQPAKVLVVEGRHENLLLTEALRDREYPAIVTSVSEIHTATQALEEEAFDIIVFDCDLERLGGADFFRQLLLVPSDLRSIAILKDPSVNQVQSLQAAGCSICVSRDRGWKKDVASHVVRLSRKKRAEINSEVQMAKQIEISKFLGEKNRRLEEFSMTVAHDIRGPLGGIAMNLEYVMDTYGDNLPNRCKDLIEKALRSSERLTGLVQEMYHYARLGSQATRMGEVSLENLVSEVIADLREAHQSQKIEFRLSELPVVWGNKDLLRQVFLNLISNAIKYNDKEEVLIQIINDDEQVRMLGRYQLISISDNGPGIKEQERESIFSMYKRGEQSNRAEDGLGVGLAIVKRIIELHLGSIEVDTHPGQGTKFRIALPAEQVVGP